MEFDADRRRDRDVPPEPIKRQYSRVTYDTRPN